MRLTFCSKCGDELKPAAKFCPKCGHKVALPPSAPPQTNRCSTCGEGMVFVQETQQWWCGNCGRYSGPAQAQAPPAEPASEKISLESMDLSALPWKKSPVRDGYVTFKCPNCTSFNQLQVSMLFSPPGSQTYGITRTNVKAAVPYPGAKVLAAIGAVFVAIVVTVVIAVILIALTGWWCVWGLVFFGTLAIVYGLILNFLSKQYPVWLYDCARCRKKILVASDGTKTLVDGIAP